MKCVTDLRAHYPAGHHAFSEELQWNNSANQGCNPGTSTNQPTADQKAKFERAVAIVDELSKK